MNKELFGVFGSVDAFRRLRSTDEFDTVVEADTVTVGIRDPALSIPNRTSVYQDEDGSCLLWGEAYVPAVDADNSARWILQQYERNGTETLRHLNGSYLVLLEHDGEATIYTDPIRSRECFYSDALDTRVFGTDAAAIGSAIPEPTLSEQSMVEFVYLSVILDDRTLLSELDRIPFDGYVTATDTGSLSRFVYRPRTFDFAEELARRLRRALERRTRLPGPKGLLLGAGYDARVVLSQIPDITQCFTVGSTSTPEVRIARLLSGSYGADHHRIPLDGTYMNLDFETVQYTNGINESIHVHQRGVERMANVRTMYHGWAFDTLLKDFFVQKSRLGIGRKSVRLSSLPENPDPATFLLEWRLGIMPDSLTLLESRSEIGIDDPRGYFRSLLESEFEKCRRRCRNEHDVANAFGVKHLPSKSFRRHIDDHFIESFVAADAELIDWHLRTPPAHRSIDTYLDALNRLDADLLRYRPPDRPRSIRICNPIEGFLRRTLPFLTQFGNAWPDIDALYDRTRLDEEWFEDHPELQEQSTRFKLRVHDTQIWLETVLGRSVPLSRIVYPSPRTGSNTTSDRSSHVP